MSNLNRTEAERPKDAMARLLWLCERLDAARVHHEVVKCKDDTLSILAAFPGERWEIDINRDGHITIERFRAIEDVSGFEHFEDLLNSVVSETTN